MGLPGLWWAPRPHLAAGLTAGCWAGRPARLAAGPRRLGCRRVGEPAVGGGHEDHGCGDRRAQDENGTEPHTSGTTPQRRHHFNPLSRRPGPEAQARIEVNCQSSWHNLPAVVRTFALLA